jgi:predicted CXXCH cytochrome family protein
MGFSVFIIHKIITLGCSSLLISFLFLFFFNVSNAEVEPPRNPNSAKGCAICHYRWVDTFFIEGRGSDLVAYTAQKVVAAPEMCMSCHDGSIMDSRARMTRGTGHKIGLPPPAEMKIPKPFPLDEEGKVQCATCHTAHAIPSGPDSEETIFLRTSNRDSAMCRECHPDRDGGLSKGNHPDGVVKLEISKKLISLGAHAGKAENAIGCETCHTAHGSPRESYLIQSAMRSGLCLDCHTDKNIFTPDGQTMPYHVLNVEPVKAQIPEGLIKLGAKFGDHGIVICQSCHKVHDNKLKRHLLLIEYDNRSTLCLTCHPDQRYLADTKHNLIHTAPEERNLEGKTVAEAGICSACHLPHKPARILTKNPGFTSQLCFSCHRKDQIAEKHSLTGRQHPLNIIALATQDKEKLTLPLFDENGIQNKNGEMTCLTCHDPHRWQPDSTKGEIKSDVKGDRTTSFLRKPSPQICAECHQDKFYIANSKHDLHKVASEEKNILNQTPSQSGLCGSCHLVHNAQETFLWARKLPYKSDNVIQDLCTGCHNEKGAAKQKVIKDYSHAVNISVSEKGFTTSLPLFDFNGKKTKDGVMGCITCHDPHRWNPSITFAKDHFDNEGNSQNSFLRLETSPSPKLCESCHPDKAYLEKTDHDLTASAPFSINIIGQTPLESGTCGVCHLVHNSENKIQLWAQGIGAGSNVMEMMCNSCHSEIGPAKNKIPQVYLHPREKLIKNTGKNISDRPDYFPLFHGRTGEPVTSGNISCPTCHNVHQWDPKSKDKGKGVNVEGDMSNSFLRPQASRVLCADCHQSDAALKFKNYHDTTKRKFKGIDELFFQ